MAAASEATAAALRSLCLIFTSRIWFDVQSRLGHRFRIGNEPANSARGKHRASRHQPIDMTTKIRTKRRLRTAPVGGRSVSGVRQHPMVQRSPARRQRPAGTRGPLFCSCDLAQRGSRARPGISTVCRDAGGERSGARGRAMSHGCDNATLIRRPGRRRRAARAGSRCCHKGDTTADGGACRRECRQSAAMAASRCSRSQSVR